ncbi:universal stress family protein [Corallococcus coralloides]|uniref:Universal stress family protein n=1 Tax=Corallococcus coralloides TaxID=184914 RepID=A0A410S1G6_CORCK|nr:universal stress protein [Corallococcus coralloides]QAT87973.1 universal stress family protein [Corallococcus coralloides]
MAIVVGTDFSDHAREAVRVAAAIAARTGTPLELVHTAEPGMLRRDWPAERGSAITELEQRLAAEAEGLRHEGLTVEPRVLLGMPDEALVEHAARIQARMLITAALGWRSEKRWRLGGVPARIAQQSRVPFLMIRLSGPFLEWCQARRPLRVTVGDDFSHSAEVALRWLPELRRVGPVELTVAHVYNPATEYGRLGLSYASQGPEGVEAILERELRERLSRVGEPLAEVRTTPSYGSVVEPLTTLTEAARADLLLLGSHQRRGLRRVRHGSVSLSALPLAPVAAVACVPVAVQREAEAPVRIPSIRRVLVSTDFSPLANLAIPHALSLLPPGGELILVHVMESPIPVVYADFWPAMALGTDDDEAELRRQLGALVPRDVAGRGITVRMELLSGVHAAQTLCQAAERYGADIFCMGSHGRTGVSRAVLGSVAQEVVAHSRRPVLVVKHSALP